MKLYKRVLESSIPVIANLVSAALWYSIQCTIWWVISMCKAVVPFKRQAVMMGWVEDHGFECSKLERWLFCQVGHFLSGNQCIWANWKYLSNWRGRQLKERSDLLLLSDVFSSGEVFIKPVLKTFDTALTLELVDVLRMVINWHSTPVTGLPWTKVKDLFLVQVCLKAWQIRGQRMLCYRQS